MIGLLSRPVFSLFDNTKMHSHHVSIHLFVFQEYGTNRPTPYTMLDEDDETTDKAKSNPPAKSTINEPNESLLSPRIFTDDASELIGRFFFGGMPSPPGSKSIAPSASFGSASTLSTMTSTKKGRGVTRGQSDAVANEDNLFIHEDGVVDNAQEENNDVTGWDQDEIDLWRAGGNNKSATVETNEEAPQAVVEDWVSHRRRLLDMQQKRWNWDELGPDISLRGVDPGKFDVETFVVPTITMNSTDILEAQRILKSTQPTPQQIRHSEGSADNSVNTEESAKRKGGGAVIVDDGKQHWMPDSLCKQCYACEAPFTLLRRKHHCRLCGMIFW